MAMVVRRTVGEGAASIYIMMRVDPECDLELF
jgi:hypothetical protein